MIRSGRPGVRTRKMVGMGDQGGNPPTPNPPPDAGRGSRQAGMPANQSAAKPSPLHPDRDSVGRRTSPSREREYGSVGELALLLIPMHFALHDIAIFEKGSD